MSLSISVVIPVFNGEAYLAEALESVRSQTRAAQEIIVVDDGSTDRSEDIARSFEPGVTTLCQPNLGTGAARNRGIEASCGDLLAFLDADDLWTPDKLALQVEKLERDPTLEVVFGHVEQFASPELEPAARDRFKIDTQAQPGYVVGTMVVRRASFDRVGPFTTRWAIGELIDWYQRARELGLKIDLMLETVLHRRIHGNNTGVRRRDARGDYVRVIKAALDRRRAARSQTTSE